MKKKLRDYSINSHYQFMKKREHGLNVVAIVISNSNYRLDASLKKAIKQLYRFFDNGNFWNHVCVIVTHCPPFPDEIAELKKSMTTGTNSLHSEMIKLIKNVCKLEKYPEIPFYFFDSLHPNCYPTNESLT